MDFQIKEDVAAQLEHDPSLFGSRLAVTVNNGVVTLSGIVDSYVTKTAAEQAAMKVAGVLAVAEEIEVRIPPAFHKTDAEIAAAAINALKWHTLVPENRVTIKVEKGIITLDGEVEWNYQRDYAKRAMEHLAGVRHVNNFISVSPPLSVTNIKQRITEAFKRSATIDSSKVMVDVTGNKVLLRGTVKSFAEEQDAMSAAWGAPGVLGVESSLKIAESV